MLPLHLCSYSVTSAENDTYTHTHINKHWRRSVVQFCYSSTYANSMNIRYVWWFVIRTLLPLEWRRKNYVRISNFMSFKWKTSSESISKCDLVVALASALACFSPARRFFLSVVLSYLIACLFVYILCHSIHRLGTLCAWWLVTRFAVPQCY